MLSLHRWESNWTYHTQCCTLLSRRCWALNHGCKFLAENVHHVPCCLKTSLRCHRFSHAKVMHFLSGSRDSLTVRRLPSHPPVEEPWGKADRYLWDSPPYHWEINPEHTGTLDSRSIWLCTALLRRAAVWMRGCSPYNRSIAAEWWSWGCSASPC